MQANMDDKKNYEAYRVRQFSGLHPALQVAASEATASPSPSAQPAAARAPQQDAVGVSQHTSNPLTGLEDTNGAAADPLGVQMAADQHRVIVHFDVDAFYSQVTPDDTVTNTP